MPALRAKILHQNQIVRCWPDSQDLRGAPTSLPLPAAERASLWAERWAKCLFPETAEDRPRTSVPKLHLELLSRGGFNSVWRIKSGVSKSSLADAYPAALLDQLHSGELVVRVATRESSSEERDVLFREASNILTSARGGYGTRVAALAIIPRRHRLPTTDHDGIFGTRFFLVAFLEKAHEGSAWLARNFKLPSEPHQLHSPKSMCQRSWMESFFNSLLFSVACLSMEGFFIFDVKLQNALVFFHAFWKQGAGAPTAQQQRVVLIDLGHDVCRRLTGAKGRPLGDDASDAWRCALVHNLLFLSAVLRRELDGEVFSECWWKGLKAPLAAMHAHLVDPANATVAGDANATLCRKFLRETRWMPTFELFSSRHSAFRYDASLGGIQQAALSYVFYYFVEFAYLDFAVNVLQRISQAAPSPLPGAPPPLAVVHAVSHFNTNYVQTNWPIARFFMDARDETQTLCGALLAFLSTPKAALTPHTLAKIHENTVERLGFRDLHPANIFLLRRLAGLSDVHGATT